MRFSLSTHLLCLSLDNFTSIVRTGLPILVKLIDLMNSVISNHLTQMVNFLTRIPDCDSHSPPLVDLFISSDASILLRFFPHWEILIMLLSQFPLTFQHICNRMSRFIAWLMTILVLIGMVFVIIWGMFHGN